MHPRKKQKILKVVWIVVAALTVISMLSYLVLPLL